MKCRCKSHTLIWATLSLDKATVELYCPHFVYVYKLKKLISHTREKHKKKSVLVCQSKDDYA